MAARHELGVDYPSMSTTAAESFVTELRVVDLDSVRARELEELFRQEMAQWRERLYWDVSGAIAALRRAMERAGVQGKAIRSGPFTAGYGYFLVEGSRGVVTGLAVSPEWGETDAGPLLVRAILADLDRRDVTRIESQFVSFDAPWLVPAFEDEGFRTYWREFQRLSLESTGTGTGTGTASSSPGPGPISLVPWKQWNLTEAAEVMQRAHEGGVDAEMNELYRTSEGCRALLTNVLRHRGCGSAVPEASVLAREGASGRAAGFAVVTETAARHAHLAQLAVAPRFQRQGIARQLLARVRERLTHLGFDTLSLMVSGANERALRLYRSLGFDPVARFPVFSRDL
jgi:ribosomal protein S18 acetylase RimI-like enzyme